MHKSQANLSVVAARAALVQRVAPTDTRVSRNLALRATVPVGDTGVSPRKGKTRKAWAHKSSDGKPSLWHSNPFYFCPVEVDRRWSA